MKLQFLYSPLCLRAEMPHVLFLAQKISGCKVENYNIVDIEEGEENNLPGEMPSIIRALRRGEGFITDGLIFIEGYLIGQAGENLDVLLDRVKEKGVFGDENHNSK